VDILHPIGRTRALRPIYRFLTGPNRIVLLAPLGIALAWFAGVAVAQGGNRRLAVLLVAAVGVAAPFVWILITPRLKPGFIHVELPVILLLVSQLVFRVRDAETLAVNPLDLAGSYRVMAVGLALALGLLALTQPVNQLGTGRVTTRPFRLYALYSLVVFVGVIASVNLPLTAYRGIEVATAVIVLAGAYRTVGRPAVGRVLQVLFWWTVASAISIWIGTVLFPGEGLYRASSPFPYQIKGIVPVISANSAGSIGAILVIWSLALIVSKNEDMARPKHTGAILLLGVVTLLFAQYRTGYVGMLFGILLLIAVRKRQAVIWVIVVILVLAAIWGSSFIEAAQPYALRGQPVDRAAGLSGRVGFWSSAIPVWQESPWIGKGLLTATRFEVLLELGRTTTSTIHGTWIEALVGTGIVGVGLLVASLITLVRRSLVEALRPAGRILPILLLGTIFVRSLTGSTIEIFGSTSLLFLALALSFRDEDRIPLQRRRPAGAIGGHG
jgi:hypothetical protein